MDGTGGGQAGGRYVPPAVTDYGDLLQMTRDVTMLHVGFGSFAAASSPGPGPGGGGGDVAPRTAGDLAGAGGGGSPGGDAGDVGGVSTGGGTGGGGADSGGGSGGGSAGSGGGGSGGGGGGGNLPFTGFPAAVAGALGAAMSAAGIAARKYLRRDA